MARMSYRKMRYEHSLSESKMTLKYLPFISSILAHRRILPSSCITSRTGSSTARRIHSSRIMARSDLERIAKKYEVNFTGMILPGAVTHCKPDPRVDQRLAQPLVCIVENPISLEIAARGRDPSR